MISHYENPSHNEGTRQMINELDFMLGLIRRKGYQVTMTPNGLISIRDPVQVYIGGMGLHTRHIEVLLEPTWEACAKFISARD